MTGVIYPIEAVEQFDVTLTLDSGELQGAPEPIEEMDLSILTDEATIREPLRTYNGSAELIDVDLSLHGGALVNPLVSIEADDEALDLDIEITEGTLRVELV